MALEIEAKIKVDSLDSVARRLGELGGRFVAEQTQSDVYFLDSDGRLAASGCGVRLRTETAQGNTVSIVTFKGPRQSGPYKTRPEYETHVADAEAMAKILSGLGLEPALTVTKNRRLWELAGCQICLDCVPPLGCFVEVEGPSESAVSNALVQLELADQPPILEGYAVMMQKQNPKP